LSHFSFFPFSHGSLQSLSSGTKNKERNRKKFLSKRGRREKGKNKGRENTIKIETKKLKFEYDKRVILPNYDTIPYGYIIEN
jgi:hypothetical protein